MFRGDRTLSGAVVLAAGTAVYGGALLVVAFAGDGRLRYTADNADTIPMWHPWIPTAVGIALVLLTRHPPAPLPRDATGKRVRVEAVALLALGLCFTVLLDALGPEEPRYTALKLALLLCAPAAVFTMTRRWPETPAVAPRPGWLPLIPVIGWSACHLMLSTTRPAGASGMDPLTLVAVVMIGVLLNAVLEELFYRRWLQSRWTVLLGGVWPAIVLSSIVWASWHIAIQGGGDLLTDLANVIANQGITGLFLGLLWHRHRVLWPLLAVHGLMNVGPFVVF